MAEATFAKLNDGSWGIRGKDLAEGRIVVVERKDTTTVRKTVGAVLWRGQDGMTLARIAEEGASEQGRRPAPRETHHHGSRGRGRRSGCSCSDPGCECNQDHCMCDSSCNCRGGNIYNC